MSTITVQLETPFRRSFRVEQVAGMLDVPLDTSPKRKRGDSGSNPHYPCLCGGLVWHELTAEVPGLDEAWTIGAIVGPSGSGKTTLAQAAFGRVDEPGPWPEGQAIVEVLGSAKCKARNAEYGLTIKDIARVLIGVGLGSVPTWLKPYGVLSGGERFRAGLARAVLAGMLTQSRQGTGNDPNSLRASAPLREHHLIVVDEFTSSLDRTLAKTTSAALARLLRKPQARSASKGVFALPRLVAVTCHADVLPWLAPDWVVELKDEGGRMKDQAPAGRLSWRPFLPAELEIEVRRVAQAEWARFARHHYLSGGLAASARCYGAFFVQGPRSNVHGCGDSTLDLALGTLDTARPIAFCAVAPTLGWKAARHISRLVVLPEFQGLGLGGRLLDAVAELEAGRSQRVTITASHPAVLAHCSGSPAWRFVGVKKTGSMRQRMGGREIRSSMGRAVAGFRFVGGEQREDGCLEQEQD